MGKLGETTESFWYSKMARSERAGRWERNRTKEKMHHNPFRTKVLITVSNINTLLIICSLIHTAFISEGLYDLLLI